MTNRKDMIDDALLRPGRLEVQVEIGLPKEQGRVDILNIHTNTMRYGYTTPGASVADPGCLSRIRLFFHSRSRIRVFLSRIRIKEFKYFNPKKWFLSSRKYEPGFSSRIPDPDPFFNHPGSRRGQKAPDPGSVVAFK
jgi:hypothetical protein